MPKSYISENEIPPNAPIFEIPHKFTCRPYQDEAWNTLKNQKKDRAVLCWHRGCGKDLFAMNWLIRLALDHPCVCLHCFPNFNQGKRAIWKSIHNNDDGEAIEYLDHIPKELIKHKNSSEMMIQLVNGSIYAVMGIDGKNAARARGMNPTHVILSEYAFMDPESWQTIEPRVKQNHGTVLFISTPNGKNHFYDLYNYAQQDPRYYTSLLTIDDTHTLTETDVNEMRAEGWPEDFIQQELYCSFDRGAIGSYYGKYIQKARDEDRICSLPIIPDLPVHTAWDIGIGDSTSIWLFQCNRNGYYNFIEYYENHSEGLEHYIKYLNRFKEKYDIEYGIHFVPHDMKHREFTSGVDRIETARGFGYEMTVVPMKKIEEGIQAVRSILPLCCFDEVRAKAGIKCLDFYRKKYNDTLKVYYDEPLHDRWSHGADAFRMAAIGIKGIGVDKNPPLDTDYEALQKFWG